MEKKLPPLKPILALPTWGQTCFNSDSEPFEITDFDLGHPVLFISVLRITTFTFVYVFSPCECFPNVIVNVLLFLVKFGHGKILEMPSI